jgi:hypothetical protein
MSFILAFCLCCLLITTSDVAWASLQGRYPDGDWTQVVAVLAYMGLLITTVYYVAYGISYGGY